MLVNEADRGGRGRAGASGEVMTLRELLGGGRALVSGPHDEELVVALGGALAASGPGVGDTLLVDRRALVASRRSNGRR